MSKRAELALAHAQVCTQADSIAGQILRDRETLWAAGGRMVRPDLLSKINTLEISHTNLYEQKRHLIKENWRLARTVSVGVVRHHG